MRTRPIAKRAFRAEDGFSMVEAIIALAIAGAMFTALAFALVGGAHATVLSRQNQQAGDLLNRVVEQVRAQPYDSLALRPADRDTGEAPRTPTLSSCNCYNPTTDTTSGPAVEQLATDPNGAIHPHVTTVTQNGGTYRVRRYVTTPVDAAGDYKRLTVVVEFTSLGKQRKRTYSTVLAPTKRGLPLPDFKFTNSGPLGQCRNPGSTAVYSFTLKNNGARDAWSFSAAPASNPSWSYYADTDGDGVWTSADSPLPTTATGVPSTGLLDPTQQRALFAVATLADAAVRPPPYTLSVTFRATSVAQPNFHQDLLTTTTVQAAACGATPTPTPTGSATASPTPTPEPTPTATTTAPAQPAPSCASLTPAVSTSAPSGTMVRYWLENPNQPNNTAASLAMPVRRDDGTPLPSGPLYNYSTDLDAAAGRYLGGGGTASSSGVGQLASWTYGMPATSTIKGRGSVTFWAATPTGTTADRPNFTVLLDVLNADGSFLRTLATATFATSSAGWDCTGFRPVTLGLLDENGQGETVLANQRLRVRVIITNAVPMRLAYSTSAYPMSLNVPYSNGQG